MLAVERDKTAPDFASAPTGILYLDKPLGVSSSNALLQVKRLLSIKKAGHGGTLDPLATGLLPIMLGRRATKFADFLLGSDKVYEVQGRLGIKTTTGDSEGEIVATHSSDVSEAKLRSIMPSFVGDIAQIPPMYSALKVGGQPLYRLARQGKTIERKSRRVSIFNIQLLDFAGETFTCRVHCGKGVYIRTLVEDLGDRLGVGAHVTSLRRVALGNIAIEKAVTLEKLAALVQSPSFHLPVYSLQEALAHLPVVVLSPVQLEKLPRLGEIFEGWPKGVTAARLVSEAGDLLGIGKITENLTLQITRLN